MSSYNNSNAAYDFAAFAPAEEPEVAEPKRKHKKASNAKSAPKELIKPVTVAKLIIIGLFVMISVGCIMVGNIKVTQLSDQIASAQKQLDKADSEKVSLNSKLESRMSLSKVEDYASNKLGLVKIQPYQLEYVNLTNKDNVEITGKQNPAAEIFNNIINNIKSYL